MYIVLLYCHFMLILIIIDQASPSVYLDSPKIVNQLPGSICDRQHSVGCLPVHRLHCSFEVSRIVEFKLTTKPNNQCAESQNGEHLSSDSEGCGHSVEVLQVSHILN